jgi:hypothetical protein
MNQVPSRNWLQVLAWAAVGLGLAKCSSGTEFVVDGVDPTSGDVGTAGFQLDVGSGITVNAVAATLLSPDGTSQTRNFDVSQDDASIAVYLGELPVGSGYQVTLSATATNGADCAGTSSFKVKKDETVVVAVKMQCSGGVANPDVGAAKVKGELIPGTGDCAAVIDRIEAAPARVGLNIPVTVEVFVTDGTAPLVTFSASGGTLMATDTRATFRCTAEGEFEVTASAARAGCVQRASARIQCIGGDGAGGGSGMGGGAGTGNMGGAGTGNAAGANGNTNNGAGNASNGPGNAGAGMSGG